MPRRPRSSSWCAAALLCLPATAGAQEATNRDQSGYTELHEEGFPAKTDPRAVTADEARLRDDEVVIGIVVDGRPRAYPVNLMWEPRNEVLNDTLGDTPIAITWCPVAHSAAVYERGGAPAAGPGSPMELGAIGLDKGVFILYDEETRSWWNQVAGDAVRGPLKGRTLEKVSSSLTTWGRWRTLHPGTSVFVDPALPGRRRFTEETFARITMAGDGPVVNEDLVVGLDGPASSRAYLLRRLARRGIANDVLDGAPVAVLLAEDGVTARAFGRSVEGRTLTFSRAPGDRLRDAETASTWDAITGRALAGPLAGRRLDELVLTYALWYAWRAGRPDATLWAE